MHVSRKRKDHQLGMPFGTANGRLTKALLFHFAQKCGLDICFRCGKRIETVDEFTKDHKVDWLHSNEPVKLFFDPENIGFSHVSCNVPRRQYRSVSGSSKYKGVARASKKYKSKPWVTSVYVGGEKLFFKRFSTEIEAAIVYDIEIVKILGQDAVTNASLGLL